VAKYSIILFRATVSSYTRIGIGYLNRYLGAVIKPLFGGLLKYTTTANFHNFQHNIHEWDTGYSV
jgi:hypothetical protein